MLPVHISVLEVTSFLFVTSHLLLSEPLNKGDLGKLELVHKNSKRKLIWFVLPNFTATEIINVVSGFKWETTSNNLLHYSSVQRSCFLSLDCAT